MPKKPEVPKEVEVEVDVYAPTDVQQAIRVGSPGGAEGVIPHGEMFVKLPDP